MTPHFLLGATVNIKKLSVFEATPRLIVRFIFYLLISPLVYKETGICTTILLGVLYLEVAVKTDWMQAVHELQLEMADIIKELVEFQNRFFNKLNKKGGTDESTNT